MARRPVPDGTNCVNGSPQMVAAGRESSQRGDTHHWAWQARPATQHPPSAVHRPSHRIASHRTAAAVRTSPLRHAASCRSSRQPRFSLGQTRFSLGQPRLSLGQPGLAQIQPGTYDQHGLTFHVQRYFRLALELTHAQREASAGQIYIGNG